MKRSFTPILLSFGALSAPALKATVTTYAEYQLGEAGSLGANNLPLDAWSGLSFTSALNGSSALVGNSGIDPRASAMGSTAYLDTSDTSVSVGWYASNLYTSLPTDNFAFGIYVQAALNDTTTQGVVFSLGGGNGAFNFTLESTGWRASAMNQAYIGSAGTFAANTWVQLTVIRSGGLASFFVDGVQAGSSISNAPVNDTAHLSVTPGGTRYFHGKMDEAKIVAFAAGTSNTEILQAFGITAVPEPSAYGFMGAAVLAGATALRRRKAAREENAA